ncbi:HAD-IA family hydrolase [Tabrizicola sp. M-4]|uniref:HAD-IA family hydrolase n=1 Tax=Tabrizicola sp. M-4 TaxID=3055847 RepID=UPI003DA86736
MLRDLIRSGLGRMFPDRMNAGQARRVAAALWRDGSVFSNPEDIFDELLRHELISFDLFDTVVRRRVPLEVVHRRTAEFGEAHFRGDAGPLPAGLLYGARHRLQAEVKARGLQPGKRNEVRLVDVFDAALRPHVAEAVRRRGIVKALVAFEVETEIAVLEVDPRVRSVIERLRDAGRKVILVSDMYLDAADMENILTALDIRRLFDRVFVSATVGVTKASGLLFERVTDEMGVPAKRCIHLGDNGHSDVTQARSRGWHARHFVDAEREAERIRRELDLMSGPVAEAQAFRATMEEFCGDARPDLRHLTAAAFSVFAREVLREAVRGGYDRVLYLTRDGTRFRWIAEDWIAGTAGLRKADLPPLQEFAFSRRAGILLNYPEMTDPDWQGYLTWTVGWLNGTPLSIRTIMRCFAVSPAELAGLTPERRAEVEGYLQGDDPATDLGFDRLLQRPDLLEPLHGALLAKRERIIAYLDQIGLFDRAEKLLLVDLGYSGTAAKAISEHLWRRERQGRPAASRMTMMLLAANRFHRHNLKEMHPRIELRQGSLIRTDRWRDRAAAANFSWLEPFAVDRSRGSLRDFRKGPGGWVPVFGPGEAGGDPARAREVARQDEEMKVAVASYHAALRCGLLSVAEVDRRVVKAWIARVIHPDARAVAEVEARQHHGGLAEVRLESPVDRIDPRHLLPEIQRCLTSDRWIQGSLTRSRLRLITPFVNPILASELQ